MNNLPTLRPANMTEAIEFSKILAGSELVPKAYRNRPQDILVCVQWGYEVGLQPLQALQNISVINGKPSIWGDAMLALVKKHPDCAGVSEHIEGEGEHMVAHCEVKRRYGDEIEATKTSFSVADAKKADLWKKDTYQKYPQRMLTMRARGFALRNAFPDALQGLISEEEAQDLADAEKNKPMKTVQVPLVGSEGDTVENILEAVSEAQSASNDIEPPTMLTLAIPGRESEQYQMQEEWAARYAELMLAMRQAEKLPQATRRTKLKELEQVNINALNSLDLELNTELKQKRLDYNKQLSVEEKGGNDDQSWPNS